LATVSEIPLPEATARITEVHEAGVDPRKFLWAVNLLNNHAETAVPLLVTLDAWLTTPDGPKSAIALARSTARPVELAGFPR